MSKLTNEQLLAKYADFVPNEEGASPVIFADSDTSQVGPWALFIQFVASKVKSIHPLKGEQESLQIVVARVMCNATATILADLPNIGETLPDDIGLFRDFRFVKQGANAPEARFGLQSGFQVFTNSSGMASFNAKGEILMLNEYIAPKASAGHPNPFPSGERLTSIRKDSNPALSQREAYFAAYANAYGAKITAPEPVF